MRLLGPAAAASCRAAATSFGPGSATAAAPCNDPALIDLARTCAQALPFVGPVNIQCRVVDGVPVVFEINPRFSGGIPLTIQAGADFPRMLVDLAAGKRVPETIGRFRDNLWMTSYETSVFLDGTRIALPEYPGRIAIGDVA